MQSDYLLIKNIVKNFDNTPVVNNVSLSIKKGEIFALLGDSGCGKSTLLRMLAGFETPSSGEIILDKCNIVNLAPYERPINMMFQSYALFPHLNVWDNIAFGLKREGLPRDKIKARVGEMLELVQMSSFATRNPHQLSGGQQQRVALARSLAKNPDVLLLDEPLGALDKKLREQTQFELVNIIEKVGVTCLLVTHDQHEAMSMADRIAVMRKGKILQIGSPVEIYDSPSNRFVAECIGNVNLLQGRLVTDDHSCTLVDTEIGIVKVHVSINVNDHTSVSLAIRPERIQLSKIAPLVTCNVFSGKIKDIAYFGSYKLFVISTANDNFINVNISNALHHENAYFNSGDEVFFWWDESSVLVLSV